MITGVDKQIIINFLFRLVHLFQYFIVRQITARPSPRVLPLRVEKK